MRLITINYLVASIPGLIFYPANHNMLEIIHNNWFPFAVIIGLLFIILFFFIGKSVQLAGISTTAVASKMSMTIPILFSLFYFSEEIHLLKTLGLTLAIPAVLLSIYKPNYQTNYRALLLPVIIFLGMGITDSLVTYTQHFYVNEQITLLFSSVVFLIALIAASFFNLIPERNWKDYFSVRLLVTGSMLGIANYGSLFFLMKALEYMPANKSVVFGINNVGIVIFSGIAAIFVFSEKMNRVNLWGILLAVATILLLSFY